MTPEATLKEIIILQSGVKIGSATCQLDLHINMLTALNTCSLLVTNLTKLFGDSDKTYLR